MPGPWKLTIQSRGTSLHKVMDSSQENIKSERATTSELDVKEKPSADNAPSQEPRPSLLDSLLKPENLTGKKLRILNDEDDHKRSRST